MKTYTQKIAELYRLHEELITRTNIPQETSNGIFTRYKYPVLTAAHTPVFWRYDLDENSNPYLMERIGMNATMNSAPSNGMINTCWWSVWKEPTVNHSLP